MNPAFAIVEIIWMMSGRNDVGFLAPWNPRMRNYSDDEKSLHGAYGHRLRSHFGVDQLLRAHAALKSIEHSRQVVLQIWDSANDMPAPGPVSKDVPCNLVSHLMIREGRLEWLQVMRSTDIIWGLPYNLVQFTAIQEIMAGWLGVELGTYNHVSDSLHVYARHWGDIAMPFLAEASSVNRADLRIPLAESEAIWPRLSRLAEALAHAPTVAAARSVLSDEVQFPDAYAEWVHLLAAERLRRLGDGGAADAQADLAGPYWSDSWARWRRSQTSSPA
jgi:thymidylate synthase